MFNSVATIAFTVNHENKDEATNEELKAALYRRIKMIDENMEGVDGYTQTCGDELTDTQDGDGFDDTLAYTNYYVVQSTCGKFADGFYGWDSNIHSDEQIFAECDLPYVVDPAYNRILLCNSITKPSVSGVNIFLGFYSKGSI